MSDSPDAQLQLKKRARRRLVGAVAFAGLAAVILPMVMDEEPKQQVQDIQIRIPGQEQAPFAPKLKPATAEKKEESLPAQPAPVAAPAVKLAEPPVSKAPEKPVEKASEKSTEKTAAEKPAAKPAEKTPEKAADKAANGRDAQRAADILGGKAAGESAPANGGQFVILIGAFSNPANVKQLQTKIGELGIKVYTESLDSPEGKKTRVRAGPFASRDAADKALEKMKRIGVNGVVAARQ
ncbi:MAG: SPOR domain-containing protein [Propionivibrio sp.]